MHSGRSVASSTVTISQGDRLCTRSLVLLSAAEDDVIRHADRPSLPSSPEEDRRGRPRRGGWEIGIVDDVDLNDPDQVGPPELDVWVRFAGAPDDPAPTRRSLRTSTDGFLIGTAMRPHAGVGQAQAHRTLSTGVLSHTLTYHEPCPAAEWHLLEQRSTLRRARSQLRAGRHLPDRRAARGVLRPGRHDPRPVGRGRRALNRPGAGSASASASASARQAPPSRASCRANQPSMSRVACCTAAAPGTSRYACGRPAITWSSQGTPAWFSRWA